MRAVIYARVSSKEQEREGYSIPAQLELFRDLASKRGYEVVQEFIDVESAKQAGRTNFGEMLEFVSRVKADAIICHKVDRLCRNFRDFVTIDDLDVSPVFVEEEFPDNASGKLTFALKVLLAKHYIDNLSDEVRKGMRQKILRGEWPHLAPYGYQNTGPRGTIELEPREAEIVLWFFKTFATGDYSLQTLRKKFKDTGLVYTDRHQVPAKGQLDRILKKPIYYGIMRIKGADYQGIHEPIIAPELFDRVQAVFKAANKPKKTKRSFTYSGMMTCAVCGCAVTAEIQKGKYVYYHCTGNRGACDVQFIREEDLALQFDLVVQKLQIDPRYYDLIIRTLEDCHKDEREFQRRAGVQLQRRLDMLQKRMDRAYVDKLDGVITEELWLQKSSEWSREVTTIENQLKGNPAASYLLQGIKIIELAKNIYPSHLQRDPSEKRKLLQILASNYSLNGRNLLHTYRKPFSILAEGYDSSNWSGW